MQPAWMQRGVSPDVQPLDCWVLWEMIESIERLNRGLNHATLTKYTSPFNNDIFKNIFNKCGLDYCESGFCLNVDAPNGSPLPQPNVTVIIDYTNQISIITSYKPDDSFRPFSCTDSASLLSAAGYSGYCSASPICREILDFTEVIGSCNPPACSEQCLYSFSHLSVGCRWELVDYMDGTIADNGDYPSNSMRWIMESCGLDYCQGETCTNALAPYVSGATTRLPDKITDSQPAIKFPKDPQRQPCQNFA